MGAVSGGTAETRDSTRTSEPFREPFPGQPRPAGEAEILGLSKDELDTPALLLDLDNFERNASKISTFLREHGVDWRPHSKAHKSPAIARRQIELGRDRHHVREGERGRGHGRPRHRQRPDRERAGPPQQARSDRRASTGAPKSSPAPTARSTSSMASAAGVAAGVDIPMLVDLNVGMERTGLAPGKASRDLARLIVKTPGVKFMGLMGYEGHLLTVWPLEEKERQAREQMGWMIETRRLIEADGIEVQIVSGGGSGTYMVSGLIEGMTEIQAGGACFMDRFYGEECHMADDFEYALSVVATVTSRPTPTRVIMDAGLQDDVRRRERPADRHQPRRPDAGVPLGRARQPRSSSPRRGRGLDRRPARVPARLQRHDDLPPQPLRRPARRPRRGPDPARGPRPAT